MTIKTFKIKGFHVLENESNATQVVLKHVTRVISGKFSCEVTTDQPGFLTDMKTATMEVRSLQSKANHITVILAFIEKLICLTFTKTFLHV